ncbi:hypothetical protein NKH71_13010, partial [Mesorhizobium sp. M0983]|uniref:hypothetical protein n=1 Tax=Mesorhizobium sp. M0983 TaxID=2957040 RepID=UPI0033388F05
IGDCNVTTVPWPLALQSKRRSLSKTFCRTFRTLSQKITHLLLTFIEKIGIAVWLLGFSTECESPTKRRGLSWRAAATEDSETACP